MAAAVGFGALFGRRRPSLEMKHFIMLTWDSHNARRGDYSSENDIIEEAFVVTVM